MARKKSKPWTARLDKPCIERTKIINEAALKSGLSDVIDIKLIDEFIRCYMELLGKYNKNGYLIL